MSVYSTLLMDSMYVLPTVYMIMLHKDCNAATNIFDFATIENGILPPYHGKTGLLVMCDEMQHF